jgi:type IV pilus assembly protein PilN
MIRINLLPVRQTRKLEAARFELGLTIAGGVLVVVLSLAAWGAASLRLASVEDENRLLQAEIDRLAADVAKVDEMEKFKAELERKLAVIAELRLRKSGPVRMIDELALATPEKLFLTELTEEEGEIELKGVSVSNDVISNFLRALEASAYFERVFLVDIEALPPEKNLSVTLKKFHVTAKFAAPAPDAVAGAGASGAAPAPEAAAEGAPAAAADPTPTDPVAAPAPTDAAAGAPGAAPAPTGAAPAPTGAAPAPTGAAPAPTGAAPAPTDAAPAPTDAAPAPTGAEAAAPAPAPAGGGQ